MLATLAQAGALAPSLDVTQVDVIEREGGHAAKLKVVKTSVKAPHGQVGTR